MIVKITNDRVGVVMLGLKGLILNMMKNRGLTCKSDYVITTTNVLVNE